MSRTRMKFFRSSVVIAVVALLHGAAVAQSRFAILHNFTLGTSDGARPQGDLTIDGTTCYGMTSGGGTGNNGTLFKCNTDGTGYQVLRSFGDSYSDGLWPYGSLTLSGTTLYGMTSAGGTGQPGMGVIFKINTDGTGFAVLHRFAGGDADGAHPFGSLILSGATLYGMTQDGGSATIDLHWQSADGTEATATASDQGTIFKINTDGTGYAVLHSFAGATWVNLEPSDLPAAYGYALLDGAYPSGSLVLSGSTLYGVTLEGGGGNQNQSPGTVFRINTDGTGYAILRALQGCVRPFSSPILSGSVLYGTTIGYSDAALLGQGSGIFRINTDGTGLTTLFAPGAPREILQGSLVQSGSVLYGRTAGPTSDTVFQVNIDGTGFAVLQTLPAHFAYPDIPVWSRCSLTLSGSALYGMTTYDGPYQGGTIFRLIPDAAWVTTQPSSQTVAIGGNATFTVGASGPPPFAYRWQRVAAGTNVWSDLADGPTYSGTGTATLTVTAATAAMNGDAFRCVCTNASGHDESAAAYLIVPTPLVVNTLAGQGGHSGASDGSGSAAQFFGPTDAAVDGAGNLYVADTENHTIRRVTPAGAVSTVAGYPGASGSSDGPASGARFNRPSGVAIDAAGNLYVADTDNDTVRKMTPAGLVTTLAGAAGVGGSVDGTGTAARFDGPSGIAAESGGTVYVADTLNHTIRRITPSGEVTTLAGTAGRMGVADGVGSAARFFGPQGLALGGADTLWVADTNNSTIRQVVISTGVVNTWAGSAGVTGSVDGPSAVARFAFPSGLAFSRGDLYLADTDNHAVRVLTLVEHGEVTTIAGKAGAAGSADGVGDAARFNHPTGLAVDGSGRVFVADTDNDTIRVGDVAAAPTITAQPQSQTTAMGGSVQFSVTATGAPAPTYQWNFNGNAISGASGSSYGLSNVQPSNAGDYTVTVANSAGSVTSNRASLTVTVPASAPSGGGGGSMAPWFAAALVLLHAVRQAGRKREARVERGGRARPRRGKWRPVFRSGST